MDINAKQARDRAEAIFKKKQERLRDGQTAMAECEAARLATREKTARVEGTEIGARPSPKNAPCTKAVGLIEAASVGQTLGPNIRSIAASGVFGPRREIGRQRGSGCWAWGCLIADSERAIMKLAARFLTPS